MCRSAGVAPHRSIASGRPSARRRRAFTQVVGGASYMDTSLEFNLEGPSVVDGNRQIGRRLTKAFWHFWERTEMTALNIAKG